jgi:acetylornithine deacetylase/succinyl-diaminopimelate desuccinylase-like protein
MPDIDAYLEQHREDFERDLCELLRIPSVSADSRHRDDVRRAANWVAHQFQRMGLKTDVVSTSGNPVVLAESPPVPGAATVLVYGHYDVQPPDPFELWHSPPFEPTIRDGNVYARGATDDKGQMLTHVKAAQAWIEAGGKLPVQLKFLIEGEEEVGSPNLVPFITVNRDRLACDCVVISDTSQFGSGQPAITYGLRGIAYYELRLTGPNRDLHSGTFGGAVLNPANVLCTMLAALQGANGRVMLPGFYEDVVPLSERERQEFSRLGFDEKKFSDHLGVSSLAGEIGFTTLERRWCRPTFDINGMTSGYQGESAKSIIPSLAIAKFSFRLVPNQDPKKISAALEARLRELCPAGIQMELIDFHGAPGVVVPLDSLYVAAAERAIEHGFGCRPVFIREGGSIPVVATFRELLGVDTLLLGWGLDDDNTHSPNEKFCLADFHRGIKASARLWYELSQLKN